MKSKGRAFESLPTEAVHPSSKRLDRLASRRILELLAREDQRAVGAVRAEAASIERAARQVASALSSGGRVFFVGAGTSGRLGVLEAAECPPTFGTDPMQIVGVMAGGERAVFHSREGAEDSVAQAEAALRGKRLGRRDLVIGISASSVTPFVRGALVFARRRKSATALVTCAGRVRGVADVVIALAVGPEVLAGSTRMKAGTATKLALNQVTLLAMVRLKKIFGPYMVDVKGGSRKLKDRAARIVTALAGVERKTAEKLLARAGGEVKVAVLMGRLDLSVAAARARLRGVSGDLREALLLRR